MNSASRLIPPSEEPLAPRSLGTLAAALVTVAINIGYDLGVLPSSMLTMLALMAIASTFVATPLIRILMRAQVRPSPIVVGDVPSA